MPPLHLIPSVFSCTFEVNCLHKIATMNRLLIVCVVLIMTACSGGDASDNKSNSTGAQAGPDGMKPIELNDGKRWKADEEMIHRVADMQEMLEVQRAAEKIDQAAVARDLDRHISKFIESCTMTGQGHEELHKWLEAYMRLIVDLSNTDSEAKKKEIMGEMIEMLKIFGEYFE